MKKGYLLKYLLVWLTFTFTCCLLITNKGFTQQELQQQNILVHDPFQPYQTQSFQTNKISSSHSEFKTNIGTNIRNVRYKNKQTPQSRPKIFKTKEIMIKKLYLIPDQISEEKVQVLGKIKTQSNPIVFLKIENKYYGIRTHQFYKNCKIIDNPLPHVICYKIERAMERKVDRGTEKHTIIEEIIFKKPDK